MERLSAEAKFFHRSCFKCDYCGTTLRLSSYAFDLEDGKGTIMEVAADMGSTVGTTGFMVQIPADSENVLCPGCYPGLLKDTKFSPAHRSHQL